MLGYDASVMPFNYGGLEPLRGIEPRSSDYKTDIIAVILQRLGATYWIRTSDLLHVEQTRYPLR